MGGVEIRAAELLMLLRVQADGAHEAQRLGDAVGQLLIAAGLGAVVDEAQHPAMGVGEIGVAAPGEGAQQVEGGRRLAIGLELAAGIGRAGGERIGAVVDDVAPIDRQLLPLEHFRGVGARLGELARHAPHLDHRQGGAEGQHDRHLQEDAEEIANVVSRMFGEALGAIAPLQQEALTHGNLRQGALELARLAREDEGRKTGELTLDVAERGEIRIDGRLLDGL